MYLIIPVRNNKGFVKFIKNIKIEYNNNITVKYKPFRSLVLNRNGKIIIGKYTNEVDRGSI